MDASAEVLNNQNRIDRASKANQEMMDAKFTIVKVQAETLLIIAKQLIRIADSLENISSNSHL